MSRDLRKEELRAELAAARTKFDGNWSALKSDANVPRRVRESVRERTGVWVGGATVVGFLLSAMRRRKKEVLVDVKSHKKLKTRKKAGILMALVKVVIGVLRPAATAYATKKLADLAARMSERSAERRLPG